MDIVGGRNRRIRQLEKKRENLDMNETTQTQLDEKQAKGCFQLLDLIIFLFGAFMMFGKTASLLGKFADTTWLGFEGMQDYYGISSALLIEGFLAAMKIKAWILPPKNLMQWISDLVVTFIPFFLSAFAQVADSWIETGYIETLDKGTMTALTVLIPLLPAFTIFLMLVRVAIENAPANLFGGLVLGDSTNPVNFLAGLWANRQTKSTPAIVTNKVEEVETSKADFQKGEGSL